MRRDRTLLSIPNAALWAIVFVIALCLSAQRALLAEAPPTSLNLITGSSLLGWNSAGGSSWSAGNGTLTPVGPGNHAIYTAVPFSNFALHLEYRETQGNAGAVLRIRAPHEGTPANSGYRIDLDGSGAPWGYGGIEQLARSTASASGAGWHTLAVEANGGKLSVQLDGQATATATDSGAAAGYLGFETSGAGLEVRGIRLQPLDLHHIFNGTDLGGWKNVPYAPTPSNGLGHSFEKAFTLGLGGGGKPHSATWTVRNGKVHGEKGPGGLETVAQYDDFLLQVSADAKGAPEKGMFPGVYLRGNTGTLGTGYPVGVGSSSGHIGTLATPRSPASGMGTETIVVSGRVLAIWINSNLATLYLDPRPEAPLARQGARTGSGVLSLELPDDKQTTDYEQIAVSTLSKTYGGTPHTAPPPAPVVVASVAPPPPSAPTPAQSSAQMAAALGMPSPADRQHSAKLMSQALRTSNPEQQMDLYNQVVQIDPGNAAAVQGYKEAQGKVERQQTSQQQAQTAQITHQESETNRQQQAMSSLNQAESAFLAGRLGQANTSLNLAERLAPSNPLVRDLRTRINAALSLRHRLFFLGTGAGLFGLAGLIAWWLRSRKRKRYPVLEMVQGLDSGRKYPLEKDIVRIGAVAQDGGQKNDIVVRDVEHAISRFHCELRKQDGDFYLVDMNSSNGTRLNGETVAPGRPALVRRGGRIGLANSVELRLEYDRKREKQ